MEMELPVDLMTFAQRADSTFWKSGFSPQSATKLHMVRRGMA